MLLGNFIELQVNDYFTKYCRFEYVTPAVILTFLIPVLFLLPSDNSSRYALGKAIAELFRAFGLTQNVVLKAKVLLTNNKSIKIINPIMFHLTLEFKT